jgi:hypothetical protein
MRKLINDDSNSNNNNVNNHVVIEVDGRFINKYFGRR